jgi:hypothetical protein
VRKRKKVKTTWTWTFAATNNTTPKNTSSLFSTTKSRKRKNGYNSRESPKVIIPVKKDKEDTEEIIKELEKEISKKFFRNTDDESESE